MMKKEKQPLRLWLKFFRALFGAIMVSFFGDTVIVILSGLILEIRDIGDFLAMLFLSGFVALIFAGTPTLVAYFIIEFVPQKYRSICVGVYAVVLGLYLEIVFHGFKITGLWLLGSMIAVVITEYILRDKKTTPPKQTEEIV